MRTINQGGNYMVKVKNKNKEEHKFKKYKSILVSLLIDSQKQEIETSNDKKEKLYIQNITNFLERLNKEGIPRKGMGTDIMNYGDTYKDKLFYIEVKINTQDKKYEKVKVINKIGDNILKCDISKDKVENKMLQRLPNNLKEEVLDIKYNK